MEQEVVLEGVYSALHKLNSKVDRILKSEPRFISKTEILKDGIPENLYSYGVKKGYLTEIKGPSRNSKILIEKSQYEIFINLMKK